MNLKIERKRKAKDRETQKKKIIKERQNIRMIRRKKEKDKGKERCTKQRDIKGRDYK